MAYRKIPLKIYTPYMVEYGKSIIRNDIKEALENNKVLTNDHFRFMANAAGVKKESYIDNVMEMRSGRFEELTGIPVTEKRVGRHRFYYRSDEAPSESDLDKSKKSWIIKSHT